ncbi:MAG TPA: glycoside hydrolase family 43 protein [bacterium]|nr:glycoside hydrolase family 43 protein [bacterium]HPN42960.1 glycoside hydrolase family 43 protein [bacterium]
MKTIIRLLAGSFIILLSLIIFTSCARNSQSSGKYNSFHPGEIWLDNNGVAINAHGGGILYENGIYYWFGEHKIAGKAGNVAQVGVHCYSSRDLYNWQDEGIALAVVEDDSTHEIAKGCILERPKVIYNAKTGKYVMWFHLELKGSVYKSARCGIAVSDKVTGPYTYIHSIRPNREAWPVNVLDIHKKPYNTDANAAFTGGSLPGHPDTLNILGRDFAAGQMSRDMTLFVDDDGTAYHICASEENSTLHTSALTDDYLATAGKFSRVFVNRFMEAPAICKYNNKYYFIGSGCTGWLPNAARSAVADSIMGGWQELGNPCVGPDSALTFHSQSTFILPVAGKEGAFIFMADRWNPENAIDGRYVWLPLEFKDGRIIVQWRDEWDLSVFDK